MPDFLPAPMHVPIRPLPGAGGLFGTNRQVQQDKRVDVILSQKSRARGVPRDEHRTALMHARLAKR